MGDRQKYTGWIVALTDPGPAIDSLVDAALERAQARGISIVMGLVEELAHRRRKPIKLEPFEMGGPDQFGCWLTTKRESHDFIFYESRTARIHQDHTILHELSHIMLGHRTYRVGSKSQALDLIRMRTPLRDSLEEREAELLATLIQQAILDKVGLEGMLRRAGDTDWSNLFEGMRLD